MTGTTQSEFATELDCSGSAPCSDIEIKNMTVRNSDSNQIVTRYACDHVVDPTGWNCTDKADLG
jgi:hypothetical protein